MNFTLLREDKIRDQRYMAINMELFTNEIYIDMSIEAKNLYGFLKSRLSLSIKNNKKDNDGIYYVIATREEISKFFKVSKPKAIKMFKELIGHGLLKEVRCKGYNATKRLYLGEIITNEGEVKKHDLKGNKKGEINDENKGNENKISDEKYKNSKDYRNTNFTSHNKKNYMEQNIYEKQRTSLNDLDALFREEDLERSKNLTYEGIYVS